MNPPRLIVGLGNPGPEYETTRHNVGFWFVDHLADKLKVTLAPQAKFFGKAGRAGETWLLEPTTFMNRSGQSVAALANFYKIPPDEILVIHDELDLPPGGIRLKQGGGNGGHNGLKDIQARLGTPDFWRLRLGIGHPGDRSEVIDYVLQRASPVDEDAIVASIRAALDTLPTFVLDGAEKAMNALHTNGKRIADNG